MTETAPLPRTTDGAEGLLPPFRNEPPMDFARRECRERFERALEQIRARFPIEAPLVIGGARRETAETLEIYSPNDTALLVGRSASATAADADEAIAAAERAFRDWTATTLGERVGFLVNLAARLREERALLAALEVFEAGKPWREADADICEAIDFLEYYAREILRLGAPIALQPHIPGERNELLHEPLGVVGVIGPWNFPLAIPLGMLSAALAAGNTAVWKPAEQTPLVTWMAMQAMERCGLPAGVVNFLPGRGEIAGQRLLESPHVHMIAFTGSREVGLHILRECQVVRPGQRHVKRVVAEMGGKNAIIVDASADIDAAVPDVLYSAFGYSGQKCSACSRLIVVEDVYAELLPRLRAGIASLKVAPAWDPGCQVGPLIDGDARRKVEEYLALGEKEGRTLFRGEAGDLAQQGHFVAPAAFEGIEPQHRLAQEEVFGPVLAVMRARDFDHALDIANGTEYALTGGVHSRTPSHLELARRRFRVGNLYFNRTITGAIVGRQPFGGFGMSGIGSKAGGPDYLMQFLLARTVTENLMRHGFAPLTGSPPG